MNNSEGRVNRVRVDRVTGHRYKLTRPHKTIAFCRWLTGPIAEAAGRSGQLLYRGLDFQMSMDDMLASSDPYDEIMEITPETHPELHAMITQAKEDVKAGRFEPLP